MAVIEPKHLTTHTGQVFLVRSAVEDDAPALLDFARHLHQTADEFNVTQAHEFVMDEQREREWVKEITEHERKLCLTAWAPGGPGVPDQLIGLLDFRGNARERMAHHGHFGISVHADWRERGVGKAMIGVLLEWARAHPKIEMVCLGVFATNARAMAVYRAMGFVEIGRRPREFKFGPGRYVDDVQMVCVVKP